MFSVLTDWPVYVLSTLRSSVATEEPTMPYRNSAQTEVFIWDLLASRVYKCWGWGELLNQKPCGSYRSLLVYFRDHLLCARHSPKLKGHSKMNDTGTCLEEQKGPQGKWDTGRLAVCVLRRGSLTKTLRRTFFQRHGPHLTGEQYIIFKKDYEFIWSHFPGGPPVSK